MTLDDYITVCFITYFVDNGMAVNIRPKINSDSCRLIAVGMRYGQPFNGMCVVRLINLARSTGYSRIYDIDYFIFIDNITYAFHSCFVILFVPLARV